MPFLIGFSVFIFLPCAIAVWIGTRVSRPALAFVLTWVTTPIIAALFVAMLFPLLRSLSPPENDGTGVFMIPLIGVATGLTAGIVSRVLVKRRSRNSTASPGVERKLDQP